VHAVQREGMEAETAASDAALGAAPRPANGMQQLPPALRRRYRVYFKPAAKADVQKLREVRAAEIGKVVTVKARKCAHAPTLSRNRAHALAAAHTRAS
jgi:hypothetical protein